MARATHCKVCGVPRTWTRRGALCDECERARGRAKHRKARADPERRALINEQQKIRARERRADPARRERERERQREWFRERMRDPEYRARRAEGRREWHRKRMQDPEYRERLNEKLREYNARPENRDRVRLRWKRYQAERWRNSPEYRAQDREWRRGRKGFYEAWEKCGGVCAYCEQPLDVDLHSGPSQPTVDHVIPRARGGADSPENRVLACQSCNSAKNDRTPREWLADENAKLAAS